jgi:hypothetical protein
VRLPCRIQTFLLTENLFQRGVTVLVAKLVDHSHPGLAAHGRGR